MVDWKYLFLAQYPAFLLLSVLFLINYLLVRKSSAVKSVLWVLLFGVALAGGVLCAFLGVQQGYWTLGTLFSLKAASWIGLVLVVLSGVAYAIHRIEVKHNKRVMEKELQKAAREKDDAVAQAREEAAEAARQAHEDGRKAAYQEAEAARFSQAAEAASAEAAASELALEAGAPIALTLDASAEPPKFDPATGQPLGSEPPKFDPMTGEPLSAPPENG